MCKQKQKEVEKREKESRRKIDVYIINMYKVSWHTYQYDMHWIHLSNTRLVLYEAVVQGSRVFYQFDIFNTEWLEIFSVQLSICTSA